jgi:D-alanyl-D-alanine carboxypeptidase
MALSVVALALGAALIACEADETTPTFSAETIHKMQTIVDEEMAAASVQGMVVGVWIPGQGTWVSATGMGDTASSTPMNVDDKVRIASITKTFTATVVLQLIEEGELTLDALLSTYVPDVPRAAEITIRHLLQHTSGLFTYTRDETFNAALFATPTKSWTPRELLDFAIAHPADNAPGEAYSYSNTNYVLLGMIVEQITGNKVEDEVQARIFDMLGMTSSSFPKTGETAMASPYSHGYWPLQEGGYQDFAVLEPSTHWTSGAIVSNVTDMKAWVEALVTGSLLSADIQAARLTWLDTGEDHTQYGYGILKYGDFIGHDGTLPGYDTAMYYLPSHRATFVVAANTCGAVHAPKNVLHGIVELLIPEAAIWKTN